jgi:hypothetical protein
MGNGREWCPLLSPSVLSDNQGVRILRLNSFRALNSGSIGPKVHESSDSTNARVLNRSGMVDVHFFHRVSSKVQQHNVSILSIPQK